MKCARTRAAAVLLTLATGASCSNDVDGAATTSEARTESSTTQAAAPPTAAPVEFIACVNRAQICPLTYYDESRSIIHSATDRQRHRRHGTGSPSAPAMSYPSGWRLVGLAHGSRRAPMPLLRRPVEPAIARRY